MKKVISEVRLGPEKLSREPKLSPNRLGSIGLSLSILATATPALLLPVLPQPALTRPAAAHTTEIAGDIAGTWHVEPNHSPRAGEPAQVWIALTRQGGTIVPLEQCDCQLAIYPDPRPANATPILEPALVPISAEQYRGIPGAEVVFPQSGQYELELRGAAKDAVAFQPFRFRYRVLVQGGNASSSVPDAAPPDTAQRSETTATSRQSDGLGAVPVALIALALGLTVLLGVWRLRSKKP